MLSLFAQMTLLITGETGGVSGRQVDPVLPTLAGVQIQSSGYRAVTHGGRACFPDRLETFAELLEGEPTRAVTGKTTLRRWRHSWLATDASSPALAGLMGSDEPEPQRAHWERWTGANQSLRCVVLAGGSDALAREIGDWEIRWSAEADVPGVGSVTEIARPLGDGSRRLRAIQSLRSQRPDLLWFDLGGLFEGRSLIRDGLDLHRKVTAQALQRTPPQLLVPSAKDLAGGLDHLLEELRPGGTQLLVTGSPGAKAGMISQWRHTQDGQRILALGLGETTPTPNLEKAVEQHLAEATADEWVILLSRNAANTRAWINDPRIALIAVPGPVRFGPFRGTWQRGRAMSGGPLILQVAPNRLLTLSLKTRGQVEFVSREVDETTTADPVLARQVNQIRHTLYPDLNRTVVPVLDPSQPVTPVDHALTEALLAHVVLRASEADAVLLPPLAGEKPLPGPISRMRLRAELRVPGHLIRRRVEGRNLLKAAAAFGQAQLTTREKVTPDAPVRLVTTAAIADRLAKALGPAPARQPLRHVDGKLVPVVPNSGQQPSSLRDLGVSLIEGELLWDRPSEAVLRERVKALLLLPAPRSALRFRIDRLSLSIQEVSLRAPVDRRAPEDPRANSPTRLSVGSQFDLRLEQPWQDLVVSLRSLGEYRRESFPSENGTEAIDKEAVDDLKGIFEVAARSGSYRPFVNLGLDSEFTAGAPEAATPSPRQMLASVDAGLLLPKRGILHEARLSATALRDYSESLAPPTVGEAGPPTQWRFGLSGLVDLRRALPVGSLRLVLGARLFLPETEPQPNTLLWAFSERVEYAYPLAGGLNLKAYFEHLSWRTHLADPAPRFADTWLSGGLSLDFSRVLRPLAGLF